MSIERPAVRVRPTRQEDFPQIIAICEEVYPGSVPWGPRQLASHLEVFPQGQLVAENEESGVLLGMAASLIIVWDDYDTEASWRDFTDRGMFTNHAPSGRTLYGAEVMVRPTAQGQGVGSRLYEERQRLVERLGLLRIRAGARLRGYHRAAAELSPEDYVLAVVRGERFDPTLSFQLRRGFHVLAVVSDYLHRDPESLGFAALIEWLNPRLAQPTDTAGWDPRFRLAAAEGESRRDRRL